MTQFGICRCFFYKNIYLHDLKFHVDFKSEELLAEELHDVLRAKKVAFADVLHQVHSEMQRREAEILRGASITKYLLQAYAYRHPTLLAGFQEGWLMPEFHEIRNSASFEMALEKYKVKNLLKTFQFPFFTPSFVSLLNEEFDHFLASKHDHNQPNTMNRKGILLGELSLLDDAIVRELRNTYLAGLCQQLYPEWTGDSGLDSHRAFTVEYAIGEDEALTKHYDNAEVTINVSLITAPANDGSLEFTQMRPNNFVGETDQPPPSAQGGAVIVSHIPGWAVLHRGQYIHGAARIQSGHRRNLIIWMRSSSLRQQHCPRCDQAPDVYPLEVGYGDGFLVSKTK